MSARIVGLGVLIAAAWPTTSVCARPPWGAEVLERGPQRPELVRRLARDPYAYFRFVNRAFSRESCRRIEALIPKAPLVHLHGDAHLEQFVVTERAAGLSDFDDAAFGPAVLDLLRFGASIFVAGKLRGSSDTAERSWTSFIEAYWSGLAGRTPPTEPDFVASARLSFGEAPQDRIRRIESWLTPLPDAEEARVRARVTHYLRGVEAVSKSSQRWRVVSAGRLRIGIGSALADKVLVRLNEDRERASQDEFLELKEVFDVTEVSCLARKENREAQRIVRTHGTLAPGPDRFLGALKIGDKTYWLHLWSHHYRELEVRAATPAQLIEIAAAAWARGIVEAHRRRTGRRSRRVDRRSR